MKIEKHISLLLLQHECVILPHFGGFITQSTPGRLSLDGKTFLPPDKRILFHQDLQANDGLLLNRISTKEKLTMKEAAIHVQEFVDQLKTELANKSLVNLSNIGKFYFDKERKLQFTPDSKSNKNINSFGLDQVNVAPINRTADFKEQEELEIISAISLEAKPAKKRTFKWQNAMKVAAVLILAAGIVFQVYQKGLQASDFQDGQLDQFSFSSITSPFANLITDKDEQEDLIYKKAPSVTINTVQKEDLTKEALAPKKENTATTLASEEKITVKDDVKVADNSTKDKMEEPVAETKKSKTIRKPIFLDPQNYQEVYIVVGAFASERNASKLIKKIRQKGLNASIIPSKGKLNRVGISGFQNFDEAADALLLAKKTFAPSAWILSKKEINS